MAHDEDVPFGCGVLVGGAAVALFFFLIFVVPHYLIVARGV